MLHVGRVLRLRPVDRDEDDVLVVLLVVDRHPISIGRPRNFGSSGDGRQSRRRRRPLRSGVREPDTIVRFVPEPAGRPKERMRAGAPVLVRDAARCRARSGRSSRTTTAGPTTRRWSSASTCSGPATSTTTAGCAASSTRCRSVARASPLELVHDVEPERGYTYTMISREPGNDQTGTVRLEPIGPNRTRFSFTERYHLTKAPFKWFEGSIYKFINKQNEASMRARVAVAHRPPRVPRRPRRDGRGRAMIRGMSDHTALVTAPFRGEGLETLQALADVVLDPWIEHEPLRTATTASSSPSVIEAAKAPTSSSSSPTR